MAAAFPTSLEQGFSVHITVYVSPDNVSAFLEAHKPVIELVCKEEECVFFEMYQNPNSVGEFSWVENWSTSPEWFMTNQATKEYYKEYFKVTEPMYVKPRETKIMKRMGSPYLVAKEGNWK